MSEFVKIGKEIKIKPNGLDYDLIPGKVYDLLYDDFNCCSYLQENGELNMPKRLYKFKGDDNFIKRCITYFNSDISTETTGVLLSGLKGSGKSVLAKRIAIESNLPIVIVNSQYRLRYLNSFFKNIKTPTCIIFDEFEKNSYYWPTEQILDFLDGVQSTSKKLVLFTCNNTDKFNDNLLDRTSRIRYWRTYDIKDNYVFIRELIKDKGLENIDELESFILKNMKVISFDNINSFLEEYKLFKDEYTIKEIFNVMNLTSNNANDRIEVVEEDDDL